MNLGKSQVARSRVGVTALAALPVAALALAAVPPAVASRYAPALGRASHAKPLIKGEEIGYFGGATETSRVSVFVYSNLGPRAGNRITVCLHGKCVAAHGHPARLAWYSASFTLPRGITMGSPVKFTIVASDASRHAKIRVTKPLLCMHNDGSVPQ